MGATLSSPARAENAELDELRRLAYGPGPGIGGDPIAQARLLELEAARRLGVPLPEGHQRGDDAPASAEELLLPRPARVGDPPAIAPAVREPFGTERHAHARSASRRGRRRRAMLATGVLAVLAAAAAASALTGASLDVTLQPRADIPPDASAELSGADELDYLGISPADVRLYDEYRGLNIWSGPRGSSSTCMFVTTDARPRWRVDCAPWTGEPTIDLIKYRESSRLSGIEPWGDMPVGSMIRLVLRDGAVIAQTVDAPGFAGSTR